MLDKKSALSRVTFDLSSLSSLKREGQLWSVYLVMLACAILAFFLISTYGETLSPVSAHSVTASAAVTSSAPVSVVHRSDALLHILLALVAMIGAGRLLGAGFRWIGQPPVIGEVIAGILLGPSLLGRIAPETAAYLLPASVAPSLGIIAQLGVILYMFVVGLELDTGALKSRGHATIAISHSSIVVPFVLGSALALFLYPRFAESHVSFTVFALFMGAAMSVTAFPVLARILTDRGISKTPLGIIALTCAATDDVTAWCLLAFVVGIAKSQVSVSLFVLLATIVYLGVMFLLVRPLLVRWVRSLENQALTNGAMAVVLIALLSSALATEMIGIHAIFGGFVLGAIFPHDSRMARELTQKLYDTVTVLLLPAFFAFTGMRTQLGLVSGVDAWAWCAAIVLVATLGKFGGTLAAARVTGMGWRDSASLGILMNTRGLMELIVLNIGLDLGIISPTIFAMMVIMAIVTTVATTPILQLINRQAIGVASIPQHS